MGPRRGGRTTARQAPGLSLRGRSAALKFVSRLCRGDLCRAWAGSRTPSSSQAAPCKRCGEAAPFPDPLPSPGVGGTATAPAPPLTRGRSAPAAAEDGREGGTGGGYRTFPPTTPPLRLERGKRDPVAGRGLFPQAPPTQISPLSSQFFFFPQQKGIRARTPPTPPNH